MTTPKTEKQKLALINAQIRTMAGIERGYPGDGMHMSVNTKNDFTYRASISLPKTFLPSEMGNHKVCSAEGTTAIQAANALHRQVATELQTAIDGLKKRLVDAKTISVVAEV